MTGWLCYRLVWRNTCLALGLLSWALQILVSNFIWLNRFSLDYEIMCMYRPSYVFCANVVIRKLLLYLYGFISEFDYMQRYVFNWHSSIVWILYGKLLIKTDASCTCLIIIFHILRFAGHRGKYVSCLSYRITTCYHFICVIFIMLIVPFF